MGTRGLALALLAAALLLQTLLVAALLLQTLLATAFEAEGLVRIALKKRPIDRNSRAATGLSRSEEQPLLTGVNTLGAEEQGDIVSLKDYMNAQYFGERHTAAEVHCHLRQRQLQPLFSGLVGLLGFDCPWCGGFDFLLCVCGALLVQIACYLHSHYKAGASSTYKKNGT